MVKHCFFFHRPPSLAAVVIRYVGDIISFCCLVGKHGVDFVANNSPAVTHTGTILALDATKIRESKAWLNVNKITVSRIQIII